MTLRGYSREWLVLALVALGTLPLVSVLNTQDTSRLALTQSIALRGSVNIDPYWRLTIDRAFADGHWYSDKAPGVAFLAVPVYEAVRVEDAAHPPANPTEVWNRSVAPSSDRRAPTSGAWTKALKGPARPPASLTRPAPRLSVIESQSAPPSSSSSSRVR